MTHREFVALGIGLVLIVLGWRMNTGSEHAGAAPSDDGRRSEELRALSNSATQSIGPGADPPRSTGADVAAVNGAPRIESTPDVDVGGASAAAPRGRSEPSLEPRAWPTGGLFVRVTMADGSVAVGAPLGVWVLGGRSPLALIESDTEGLVHFVDVPTLAARYEVGLAAPGGQRVVWPLDAPSAPTEEGQTSAALGLERAAPLALVLPRCGTLEVHVVRASRPGTRVELGQGEAAAFQVSEVRAAEPDGVARFAWVPLGLELTLRVPFDEGTIEAVVAGPVAPPALGAAPEPLAPARRVSIGPEGLKLD